MNLLTIAGLFADAMARLYYTDEVVGFFCEGDSAPNEILMDGSDDELGFDEIEISEHDHDNLFDFLPIDKGKYYNSKQHPKVL